MNASWASVPLLQNTNNDYLSLSKQIVKSPGKKMFKVGFQRELVQGCEPSLQTETEALREMKGDVVLHLYSWLEDVLQMHKVGQSGS